jgi:hypothetical protein
MEKLQSKPRDGSNLAQADANRQNNNRALPVEVRASIDRTRNIRPSVQSWKEIASELDRSVRTKSVQLLQSISDLIASASANQAEQRCHRCQSPMQSREGHFWIYGTNIKWQIPLAICPECDADVIERFPTPLRVQ